MLLSKNVTPVKLKIADKILTKRSININLNSRAEKLFSCFPGREIHIYPDHEPIARFAGRSQQKKGKRDSKTDRQLMRVDVKSRTQFCRRLSWFGSTTPHRPQRAAAILCDGLPI